MRDPMRSEVVRVPRLANPIDRSVRVNGEEYRLLSPIIIDLERGVITFTVQRDITATDGKVYTVSEKVVLHDGIEAKRVQLPNGKFTMSSAQVSRFSDAWGVLGSALRTVVERSIMHMKGIAQNPNNKGA